MDERRPAGRRGPTRGTVSISSAPRRGEIGERRARRRRPRRRRDGCRARAWQESGRPACRPRAGRAARSGSSRPGRKPPRHPGRGRGRGARALPRTAARRCRRPHRGRRRRRRRDGCPWTRTRADATARPRAPGGGRIASTRPYSTASAGVMNRSRSMSSITVSTSRPAWRPMISAIWRGRRGHLARGDLDVGGRSPETGAALVDHQLRVRQREALAGGTAGHDHRRGGHPHSEADRRDVRSNVLHRVVDRHAGIGRAAGELTYSAISRSGSSASSSRSCATIRLAISSSTSRPRNTILSGEVASRCRTRAPRGRPIRSRSGSLARQASSR